MSRFVAAVLTAVCFGLPAGLAQESTGFAQADTVVQAPDIPPAETPSSADNARVVEAIVTGYANGADGGAVGSTTASGVRTHWGTLAADWRVYPLGTRVQIEGFPDVVFVVEDTGGGLHGNIFDVWFPDLAAAQAFGTRALRVTVLQ